jgi:hypothetical protein
MVGSRINPGMVATRVSAVPDDRLVTASALVALAILLLMLLTGAATAEDAAPERQDRAGSAVAAAQGAGTQPYFPGNTHYTPVKLSRAAPAK